MPESRHTGLVVINRELKSYLLAGLTEILAVTKDKEVDRKLHYRNFGMLTRTYFQDTVEGVQFTDGSVLTVETIAEHYCSASTIEPAATMFSFFPAEIVE